MSQHVARDLVGEIGRAAHYDGPILSIGRWNNSLARMNVRNGSHGLHLDPQIVEIWGFSGFRPHNVTLSKSTTAGGPIFGKATKVATSTMLLPLNFVFS